MCNLKSELVTSKKKFSILLGLITLVCFSFSTAQAQTPVVNTTISVDKTGSEPFDTTTWDGADNNTAGFDQLDDNNVVRLQDSITYQVEVSLNDAPVTDLFATVTLNEKQTWIEIPTGCKTDAADVTTQPVSNISADGTVLFCNLGVAVEGTTKVVFPAARAVGVDPVTGDITLNNDVVTAGVTAGADTFGDTAADGPTEVIVTAFFRVNTIKEPKINATDPDSGAFLYKAVSAEGPNGEAGWLVEYRVSAIYIKGSMIADSNEVDFLANYSLIDFLTDDNTDNNDGTISSSGGVLYTWDASLDACYLDGDHGGSAGIDCTQAANQDFSASNAPITGYATDGIDDPVVNIELTDIDVRDPDADSNLFEFVINIWFDQAADIRTHQACNGTACTVTVLNDVGVDDSMGGVEGFNPVSTEDASMNNLDNYNGAGEPLPNRNIYALSETAPGPYATYKSFFQIVNTTTIPKSADQFVPAGATVPFFMTVADHRLVDQSQSQLCDKVDTSVYEFAGLSNGLGNLGWIMGSSDDPISIRINTVGVGASITYLDGSQYMDILYSTYQSEPEPVPTVTATAATIAWHESLRDDTCEDDVNGDGIVNIKLAGVPAPDPVAPIDWYEDATEMPGGQGDTAKIRIESTYPKEDLIAIVPAHDRFIHWAEFDLTVKPITEAYGVRNLLPNWMSTRRTETTDTTTFESWLDSNLAVTDFEETSFSTEIRFSDRNILVPSGQSIEKYTEPRGIKVVRAGDVVDFIVEAQVFGLWNPSITTVELEDNLPNGTDYVVGSEQFSTDGGVTWLSRADYDASGPDVTVTSVANGVGADPLYWDFGSVESGDQLPLVRYSVEVDASLVSGSFTNTAKINDTGIGEEKSQAYTLSILPEFGLDVVKAVDYPIYQTNEAFSFDLTYKNLGGEGYTTGSFIDVLPFVGDGAGATGGLASGRIPASTYSGIYEVGSVSVGNNETVYATTTPSADIEIDPCHESNQLLGAIPTDVAGDVCFNFWEQDITTPAKPAETFTGGSREGTETTVWVACTNLNTMVCGALDPQDITALRIDVPVIGTSGGETVTIELEPTGNIGGEPNLDALGLVNTAATGDVYTNTFGGRVPEISLNVISNDVSVTVVSGSIGDTVWYDLDGDGEGPAGVGDALDPTEPPIPGVMVALLDSSGAPVYVDPDTGGIVPAGYINPETGTAAIPYVAVTDAMGTYSFDNLPAAEYTVVVTPPTGADQTYDADDGVGASDNQSTHNLLIETDEFGQLIDIEDNVDQDFGYSPPLQVGSTVWLDIDNSGTQDVGEAGIAGVVVQLFPVGANPLTATPVDMAITDANGDYLLNTATPGDYFVYIPEPPAVASLSSTPANTNIDANSDIDGDDNGIQVAGGDPVQSSPLTLTFGGEPDDAAENAIGVGGDQDNGALDANGNMTVDFGFYPTGSIGDQVFVDYDGDGIIDPAEGEAGIGGVTVTLTYTDLDGTPITLMTTTALDGSYLFDDLPLNVDYTVTVDTSTLPGVLGDSIEASYDPDGGNDNSSMITLTPGMPDNLDQDFGYRPIGSVGDTIWYDTNNDGVIDADEMGIEDVTLALEDQFGNPIFVDATGSVVPEGTAGAIPYTTTTGPNGEYLFDQLPAGDYTVVVTDDNDVLADYIQTYDADDGATNSPVSGLESEVSLVIDPTDPLVVLGDLNQDFGFVEPVSIGGFIWSDLNADGIQDATEPPIPGSTVTLLNADGTPATDFNGELVPPIVVGPDGQYLFDNLLEGDYKIQVTKPSGYAPSPVQNDADDDDTANDSNIASEPSPEVYESGVFTLTGGGEPSGADEGLVGDDQDDAAIASDESGNMTVDFAFVEVASIGDTVWLDMNNDGVQDANESGLAGVTVNLYEDTDGDGVISGTEATTPVATVMTGPDGEYLFPDLTPGVVYQTGVDVTTVPDGLLQTFDEGDGFGATDSLSDPITLDPGEFHDTADFGYGPPGGAIGDTIWVDSNDDGVQDPGELGIGGVVVNLTYIDDAGNEVVLTTTTAPDGSYLFTDLPLDTTFAVEVDITTLPDGYVSGPSGLGDPDVRDGDSTAPDNTTYITLTPEEPVNLEADFGYLPPPGQDNTIGDTIYLDADGDGTQATDGTEPGIEGVTVALIDADGNVLAVTTTDADGNYSFTGVPDGVYDVVVTDATGELSDFTQTGDPDGALDNTSTVSLDPTSVDDQPVIDLDQDFGYEPPVPLGIGVIGDTIFLDADKDGLPGDGEGIGGVVVELYDGMGNLLASTITDSNGNYLFEGLEVDTGIAYEVRVDTDTLPAGLTNSVDPETVISGTGDSVSSGIVLTTANPENLDQDFGYTSLDDNTISGTVWPDADGNGLQDEAGSFAGVTIELRDEDGNVIQSTTTDADGNYAFTNLPDGIYTVVVTDEDGILDSASHTDTPNGTSDTGDETSKDDQGYVVDLDSGGLDSNPVTDATGDFGYTPIVTNPITLGSFSANVVEGAIQIDWATQAEVSNLGFNVYASVNGDWVKLNESLILSQGDSTSIQSYTFIAAVEADVFALGDIDVTALETVHGPFMLGQSYGEIGERQMIDWSADKAEREAKQADRDAQRLEQQRQRNEERRLRREQQSTAPTSYLNEELMMLNESTANVNAFNKLTASNELRASNKLSASWLSRAAAMVVAALVPSAHAANGFAEDIVNLKTTEAGIHQVSFADFESYGVYLSDTPVSELTLINQGVPVQISVVDDNADGVFGAGDAIRFIASQVDTLYSDTNVYTLRLDTQVHSVASIDNTSIPSGASATAYLAKARFAPQSSYSFASPDKDDPWFATSLVASGSEVSETMVLDLDNVAPGGNTGSTKAKLRVNVWGASTLSGSADDHHVKVNFNNAEVASSRFDGLTREELNVELSNVLAGNNRVELTLPMDTGYEFDKVNVDEVEVSYPRQFVAIDDRLDFPSTFRKFTVAGFSPDELVVMREDSDGVSVHSNVDASCRSTCSVQFGGTGQLAQYYVSTVGALHSPSLAALPLEQDITSANAVYLIISHPDFVDASSLQNLQADLVSEMGSAQIVDVDAIYAQFGNHLFDPTAIQAYIKDSVDNRGTQYVLLVGGDVYDYRQFENQDATSFIPSIYASTGNNINFAPVDAKYVDLDDDNVPDLPIGRLPVRTVTELDSLLSKRTDYLARTYQGKILLVADEYDVAQQYDFASDADEIDSDFLSNFSVTKAYVDDLGVQAARASVVNQINAGQSMTAFFGHSSTNQWAFNGLFTGNDAAGLSNAGKPTVVTQWGCWNTYYVSPNEDSMGHRFMMEGDQGAVAVMGASTLTNANSERELARLVLARIANGERLGDAITNAKQEYALENPNDLDVLLGWTLLGLPDLVIN